MHQWHPPEWVALMFNMSWGARAGSPAWRGTVPAGPHTLREMQDYPPSKLEACFSSPPCLYFYLQALSEQ